MTGGGTEVLLAIAGAKGVFQSPDGHYWRVGIDNAGLLTTTDLGTDVPAGAVIAEQGE